MSAEAEAREMALKLGATIKETHCLIGHVRHPAIVVDYPEVAPLYEGCACATWDEVLRELRNYADRPKTIHRIWDDLEVMTDEQRKQFMTDLSNIFCQHCGRLYAPDDKERNCQCWNDE